MWRGVKLPTHLLEQRKTAALFPLESGDLRVPNPLGLPGETHTDSLQISQDSNAADSDGETSSHSSLLLGWVRVAHVRGIPRPRVKPGVRRNHRSPTRKASPGAASDWEAHSEEGTRLPSSICGWRLSDTARTRESPL